MLVSRIQGGDRKGIWGQINDGLNVDPVAEYADGQMNNPNRSCGTTPYSKSGRIFHRSRACVSDFTQAQATGQLWDSDLDPCANFAEELDYDLQAVQSDSEGRYSGRSNDPVYSRRLTWLMAIMMRW